MRHELLDKLASMSFCGREVMRCASELRFKKRERPMELEPRGLELEIIRLSRGAAAVASITDSIRTEYDLNSVEYTELVPVTKCMIQYAGSAMFAVQESLHKTSLEKDIEYLKPLEAACSRAFYHSKLAHELALEISPLVLQAQKECPRKKVHDTRILAALIKEGE